MLAKNGCSSTLWLNNAFTQEDREFLSAMLDLYFVLCKFQWMHGQIFILQKVGLPLIDTFADKKLIKCLNECPTLISTVTAMATASIRWLLCDSYSYVKIIYFLNFEYVTFTC